MSEPQRIGPGFSFRARLTAGLIAGAVVPLAIFGLVLVAAEVARTGGLDSTLAGIVVFLVVFFSLFGGLIVEQVGNGVSVRMAVLYLLLGGNT